MKQTTGKILKSDQVNVEGKYKLEMSHVHITAHLEI